MSQIRRDELSGILFGRETSLALEKKMNRREFVGVCCSCAARVGRGFRVGW
jgi:hypothetical protein